MRQSKLFTKTTKNISKEEVSLNAQLLIRAGFVHKQIAGAYSFLPLGLRVINKINNIIREEMNKAGGQELHMTVLQNKEIWEKTDRWSDEIVDNWFKTELKNGTELGLGFTHEEPIANIMTNFIRSYKDLPLYAYQIQTKFRNEARAKAGMLRGREFLMKDLYSFSTNKAQHEEFYEKMKDVYMNVYNRLGIGENTYITISSGGSFSKYSYEFQTLSEAGEDIVYIIDEKNKIAINKDDFNDEVLKDFDLDVKEEDLPQKKSIEVGDIYSLGDKYAKALDLRYADENGEEQFVYMGSYGMSTTRLMGTVVEVFNDDKGIIWPEAVAPFKVHLISLSKPESEVKDKADKLYDELVASGVEVLYDDREDARAGEKFADADLIGIPYRLVISEKTLANDSVEVKQRGSDEVEMVKMGGVIGKLS